MEREEKGTSDGRKIRGETNFERNLPRMNSVPPLEKNQGRRTRKKGEKKEEEIGQRISRKHLKLGGYRVPYPTHNKLSSTPPRKRKGRGGKREEKRKGESSLDKTRELPAPIKREKHEKKKGKRKNLKVFSSPRKGGRGC